MTPLELLARQRPDKVGEMQLVQHGLIVKEAGQGVSFDDRAEGFVFGRMRIDKSGEFPRTNDLLLDDGTVWAHFTPEKP